MSWRTDDYASRGDPEWLDAPEDRSPEYFDQPYAADHVARKMLEATIARAFHKRVMKEFLRLSQDYPTLPLILTEKRLSVPCTAPDEFPMAIETDRDATSCISAHGATNSPSRKRRWNCSRRHFAVKSGSASISMRGLSIAPLSDGSSTENGSRCRTTRIPTITLR